MTNILEDTLREYFPSLKVQKNFSNGKICANYKGKDLLNGLY